MRDILVELAASRVFRARWTNAIHDEWITNLLLARPDLMASRLARTRNLMDEAVLDCLVTDYENLIATVHLPDAGDRHVVAAAIAARAEVIVTFNLADFPRRELTRFGVEALHPDEFLCRQLAANEPTVLAAARRCRTRLRRPQMRVDDYLTVLARQGLEETALRLRPHAAAL